MNQCLTQFPAEPSGSPSTEVVVEPGDERDASTSPEPRLPYDTQAPQTSGSHDTAPHPGDQNNVTTTGPAVGKRKRSRPPPSLDDGPVRKSVRVNAEERERRRQINLAAKSGNAEAMAAARIRLKPDSAGPSSRLGPPQARAPSRSRKDAANTRQAAAQSSRRSIARAPARDETR